MLTNTKRSLLKAFSLLTGSVLVAQLISIISSPILTRLFLPAHLGILATYTSILVLLSVVSTFRYSVAIPSTDSEAQEVNLFSACILISVTMFFLICILTYFFSRTLLIHLGLESMIPYRWFLPIGFLSISIYQTASQLAIKQKRYPDIAKTKISQALSQVSIQILLFKLGSSALISGHIIGQSFGSTRLLSRVNLFNKIRKHVSPKSIKNILIKYIDFPKYSLFSTLMNNLGGQLPVIMLSALFTPAMAGYYAIAQRVIFLPIGLVTQSLTSLIFGEGRQLKEQNNLGPNLWLLHKFLLELCLPLVVPVALSLPFLFEQLFGQQWRTSGEFSALLMPWFILVFAFMPIFDSFEVFYSQRLIMVFHTVLTISRIAAIIIGYIQDNIYYSLIYFSLVSVLVFLCFFFILLRILQISKADILRLYFYNILSQVVVLSPLLFIFISNEPNMILIIFSTFILGLGLTLFNIYKNIKSFNFTKG